MSGHEELETAEFGFPGELRDRLVSAILDGAKTATVSLLLEYELDPAASLPSVGKRAAAVDSEGRRVAVIETIQVRIVPAGEIEVRFVRDEGEGFETVADRRRAHAAFRESDEPRAELGLPDFRLDDETPIVTERFRLVERID